MQFQDKFSYKMYYFEKYIICNSTIISNIIKDFRRIKNRPTTLLESSYNVNKKMVCVYWNNNSFKLWMPFDVSPEIERRIFWRIISNEILDIYEMQQLSSIEKIYYLSLIYYPIHRDYFFEFGFYLDAYCKQIMKEILLEYKV